MGKKYYYTLKVYLIVTMKIPHHTNLIFGPKDLGGIEENFSSHISGHFFDRLGGKANFSNKLAIHV